MIRTEGDIDAVLAAEPGTDAWPHGEIRHYLKRTLKRLDVTSRSLIALIEPGSCFAGLLLELALACDRQYMLDDPDRLTEIELSHANFGDYPMGNGLSRLAARFHAEPGRVAALEKEQGRRLGPGEALELGLVTFAPDDLDWDDEVRLALEERAALSPDALTGMEASLRFMRPRDHGDQDLRPPGRLAELDLHPPERLGARGRAAQLRHRLLRPVYDRERA